jgi:AraC family transcriptional activator FtrA
MREQYPDTAWIEGVRWVEDGNFVSSGGLSSGIDAALAVVRRVRGEREARRVASHVGADPRFLDDPRFAAEPLSPITIAGLVTGDDRRAIGMRLEDGVDELALAATLDLVAVSMLAQPYTIASERRAYRSRHGLWLAPRVLDGERAIEIVPASDTPGYDGAIALLTPLLGALPAQVAGDALLWPARD